MHFGFKPLRNHWKTKRNISQINRKIRKKKELYLLLCHTSMFTLTTNTILYCNPNNINKENDNSFLPIKNKNVSVKSKILDTLRT